MPLPSAEQATLVDRADIFLDFLDPDNQTIYGWRDERRNPLALIRTLCAGLNVAVLICGERCLLPPFFALESRPTRAALKLREGFLQAGLVQFPLRESSLSDFFHRKQREYAPIRHRYPGLYDNDGAGFVDRNAAAVVRRGTNVGSDVARRWSAGVDSSALWIPIKERLDPAQVDQLVAQPQRLLDRGAPVTESGILATVGRRPDVGAQVEYVLQHNYTASYLDHYKAEIIRRLPPKTTDLDLGSNDLLYDFGCLRPALLPVGLWPLLGCLGSEQILAMRSDVAFLSFLDEYARLCRSTNSVQRVVYAMAVAAGRLQRYEPPLFVREATSLHGATRSVMTPAEFSRLGELLHGLAGALAEVRSSGVEAVASRLGKGALRPMAKPSVFLVHGTDHARRDRVRLHLMDHGLKVSVMQDVAHGGRTLPEKFEETAAQNDYVVALATADDQLTDSSTGVAAKRTRQNVLIEIGYFWALFGRKKKFSLLVDEAVELPSDLQGIGYIPLTSDLGQTFLQLDRELRDAGILPPGSLS